MNLCGVIKREREGWWRRGWGVKWESGWSRSFQCILFGVCEFRVVESSVVYVCVECKCTLSLHVGVFQTASVWVCECVDTRQDTRHARSRTRWFVNKSPKAQLRRHPPMSSGGSCRPPTPDILLDPSIPHPPWGCTAAPPSTGAG